MTALLGAALTAAACYMLGARLIALVGAKLDRWERFPLAFLLGAACLHLVIFGASALRIAYWPVVMIVMLAAICCTPRGAALQNCGAVIFTRALAVRAFLCAGLFSCVGSGIEP